MKSVASITIDGHEIYPGCRPYFIAEISANHMGEIDRALQMISAAKEVGADAVKIQTYHPDRITMKSDRPEFKIKSGIWNNRTLHDLYSEAQTPESWHPALFAHAKQIGITVFSSPFDLGAVDLLESLDAPAYKIASFEIIDLQLIERVARTGKPIIMSTGLADEQEIAEAIHTAKSAGAHDIILLHCISAYPTPPENANLATMLDMANRFGLPTGLSDHTLTTDVPIAASALGAVVIEKHFTLSRSDGGADAAFSLEPNEFRQMVTASKIAHSAIGDISYGATDAEGDGRKYRRSLYYCKDLPVGHIVSESDIISIRPGVGLKPKYLKQLINNTLNHSVKHGEPVSADDFETQVIK